MNNQFDKILIIQFKPYGDVLLTTSYLKALRNRFPDSQIDFLVGEPFDEILQNNPYLSNLIILPRKKKIGYVIERIKLFRKVRKRKYDLIIDQQNTNSSAQVVLFSGAQYRLGWYNGKGRWFYNLKAKRGASRYSASKKFDILSPLDIKEQPYKLFYHIKSESRQYIENWLRENNLTEKPIICLSPGSPVLKKKWDVKNYAELADTILEKTDFTVVLLWGPREYDDIQQIVNLMQHKPIIAPPTNLNQAAAFLTHCKLLICNDGGINHLSVATETPSLALFGTTFPKIWSPAGTIPYHYHLHNPKCVDRLDKSFGITPQEAFEKFKYIIQELEL